ncbi:alpha/beta hydrolase [Candidatus Solirubrobacter pratensis]|uniref:alpha/beta hydrolase n=1 Tax=Candidatus Solirubrobacter pratensis TaxID=1298857 RepID=UPI0018C939BC|nr:alpha/beta hydrolase [Candidatus Solirubrobacter pratensis]
MRRLLVCLALLAAGCGGGAHRAAATAKPAALERDVPRLSQVAPCTSITRASCAVLQVPLDHSGRTAGTLDLCVAMSGPDGAPVLVFLSGGPGQPGLPFLATARSRLGAIAKRYRLVVIDQRGTGRGALRCPALQRQMGASDLARPTAAAVRSCAARIGEKRRYFTTGDTVADLELLRQALGAGKLALDGVSYGTYVAERYALAHPANVSRLVLDSVVPHAGVTLMSEVSMQATPRVLGPAATRDLAAVVRSRHDGPELLDMLTSLSIGRPHLGVAVRALRSAAAGDRRPLDGLAAAVLRGERAFKASDLSQGLHASTLCADTRAPWGGEDAPAAGRAQKLRTAAAGVDVGPYDRETASANGIALQCLYWPTTPVAPPRLAANLPAVPTLLLAGTKDLSTPLEWARAERAHAPRGKLVVVPGAGHSLQTQGVAAVKRALAAFLTG